MTFEVVTLLIRITNLMLWLIVLERVINKTQPLSLLARRMVALAIGFGMTVFVIGALVPFGIPPKAANLTYTAFAVFASIIALALLSTGEPNGGDDE